MFEPSIYFSPNQKQQGAATLLVATLLLVVALVITLASYKGVFFQAKRVQNEIEARKLHWRGEGRLECVLAKLVDVSSNDPNSVSYNDCDQPTNIQITRQGTSNLYTVESNENGYKLSKVIRLPGVGSMGALSANADVYFIGSHTFNPQPLDVISGNQYSCLSVKYSKNVYLSRDYSDSPVNDLKTQIPTTPELPGIACDSLYMTDIVDTVTTSHLYKINDNLGKGGVSLTSEDKFKDDFKYENDFDPFQDLFGVPLNDLASIKDEFEVISGGKCALYGNGTATRNPSNCSCDTNIANQILDNKKLIWVDGNCDIGLGTKIQNADVAKGSTGTIVVIQNGIFSSTGSVPFNGVLYQLYTNSFSPSLSIWDDYTGKIWANSTFDEIERVPIAYLSGSYDSQGLVVIDAPDQLAVFQGSISFSYNKSKIENPLGQLLKPKWLKGSWHDF